MLSLTHLIFILLAFGSLHATENDKLKEIKVAGKLSDWVIGRWNGKTVATDPQHNLEFTIDAKGNVTHTNYLGWDQEPKRLLLKLTGKIDFNVFNKTGVFSVHFEKGGEKVSMKFKVKFVKGGALFLLIDEDLGDTIYDYTVFKRAIR